MNISLKPETEALISEKVRRGEFDSPGAMVEHAVAFLLDFEVGEMDGSEFAELRAAVQEGLDQADRGEGLSVGDFDRAMRAKYGIQR